MTDTPRFIQREFDGFIRAIDLEAATDTQRREMRRAFFVGARAYSNLLMTHAEAGDEPTDNDMALMEALEVEMAAFCRDVREGRA